MKFLKKAEKIKMETSSDSFFRGFLKNRKGPGTSL